MARFFCLNPRVSWLSFAALLGACHLVVSPSGDTEADEAGATARTCGEQACRQGTVCCNASCGICTPPGNACIQIACEPSSEGKTCQTLRCAVDESCMETPKGALCVPSEEDPCQLADCQPNSECKVVTGAAICVTVGSSDAGPPPAMDAGVAPGADAGSTAKDAGKLPLDSATPRPVDAGTPHDDASVPVVDAGHTPKDSGLVIIAPITCATVLCAAGTYCDDVSGSPQCIPLPSCNTVRCSAGYHCELQQVQCIRAPCPAQPACVKDKEPKDPCEGRCKANQHCEVLQGQCITYPCNPIGQCVPDGPVCGCNLKAGACLDVLCPVVNPEI